jgi:hypothetical protein
LPAPLIGAPQNDPYVQQIARDLGLSIEEASRRSGLQPLLLEIGGRVSAALGSRVLETELDFECSCLIATVSGTEDAALVESLGARPRVIDPAVVKRIQAVRTALDQLGIEGASAWSTDWKLPGLDVFVPGAVADPQTRLLLRTIRAFGVEVRVTPGIIVQAL